MKNWSKSFCTSGIDEIHAKIVNDPLGLLVSSPKCGPRTSPLRTKTPRRLWTSMITLDSSQLRNTTGLLSLASSRSCQELQHCQQIRTCCMVDVHRANRFGGVGGLIFGVRDLCSGAQKRPQNGAVSGTKVWSYVALAAPNQGPFSGPKTGPRKREVLQCCD